MGSAVILSGESARDGDYALGDLAAIRAHPHHVDHNFEGYTHRDLVAPTLVIEHRGPAVDATLTAGLVWWKTRDATDLDYTAAPEVTRDNSEEEAQTFEEFRLASAKDAPLDLSDDLKLKWQTGCSLFTQNYQQDALNSYAPGVLYQANEFGPGVPPTSSPANTEHAPQSSLDDIGVGAFAQTTVTAWEKLDLSAGVHGDYEEKSANLNTFFVTADPMLGAPTHLSPSRSFCEGSPQASAAWRFAPGQTVYATLGRGYKAGGFNPIAPAGHEAYGEESSWSYEIGAKTTWLDDRLSANLAAFYLNWDSLQLNLPTSAPGEFYIANAAARTARVWNWS